MKKKFVRFGKKKQQKQNLKHLRTFYKAQILHLIIVLSILRFAYLEFSLGELLFFGKMIIFFYYECEIF